MQWSAYIWLILMVIFLIVEAACPIHLVSIWFVIGSLVAMFAGWLCWPLWVQIGLFLIVSCGLLALLWPLTKKYLNPAHKRTNIDSVIDSTGVVIAAIDNIRSVGQVKLGAMEWTARSTSGEPIPVGTVIRVDRIEGVKVFVTPAEVSSHV